VVEEQISVAAVVEQLSGEQVLSEELVLAVEQTAVAVVE